MGFNLGFKGLINPNSSFVAAHELDKDQVKFHTHHHKKKKIKAVPVHTTKTYTFLCTLNTALTGSTDC